MSPVEGAANCDMKPVKKESPLRSAAWTKLTELWWAEETQEAA